MKEIWKSIIGYEGLYQVSNIGRVKSFWYNKERILKQGSNNQGYKQVVLCKNGIKSNKRVNRLVAEAFIKNTNNNPEVNHINEIKSDNRVENLEWLTSKENSNHGSRNKRMSTLKNKPVIQIKNGEIIKIWESAKNAGINGYSKECISCCCAGKQKYHKGYKWEFLNKL